MRRKGFTLIELMIVVAIIGILASVAVPKFADLINKSREGSTKGNLSQIRSALSIYYADNEGRYPAGLSGTDVSFLRDTLTANSKYLKGWPGAYISPNHTQSETVNGLDSVADMADTGSWGYVVNSADNDWGKIFIECSHSDTKGILWSSY